jgi:xanthosine utilization system XapX-like protein
MLKIAAGFGLIIVGLILALPLVPGPGLPLAAVGLVILSEHFPWAKRIVDWGKAKIEAVMARFRKPQPQGTVQPEVTGPIEGSGQQV